MFFACLDGFNKVQICILMYWSYFIYLFKFLVKIESILINTFLYRLKIPDFIDFNHRCLMNNANKI